MDCEALASAQLVAFNTTDWEQLVRCIYEAGHIPRVPASPEAVTAPGTGALFTTRLGLSGLFGMAGPMPPSLGPRPVPCTS